MGYEIDLRGKVAVVTGGNGGIGLGVARAIAAAGADVSIWGTNAEKNATAEEELQAINPSASALRCNVADQSEVDAAIEAVIERYGRIDACFPNAGIGNPQPGAVLGALRRRLARRARRQPPRRLLHPAAGGEAHGRAGRRGHDRDDVVGVGHPGGGPWSGLRRLQGGR